MRAGGILWPLGLLLASMASHSAAAATPLVAGVPTVRPAFSASMPERFGGDQDGDGLVDLPNTAAYVQNRRGECGSACGPARFTLRLDASASRASMAGVPLRIVAYRWRITDEDGFVLFHRGPRPVAEVQLPEGTYRVALDVQAALDWGTATARVERAVEVEDLLIVALGDSYASGEGNPERPRASSQEAAWADSPGQPAAEAAHAAAHRSTASWPALVAVALEGADPATSVTFVSLATTGAQVSRGLLWAEAGDGSPGQLAEVAALVGERRIDALLMAVGGNDVGFARVVRGLVDADPQLDPMCYDVDLANVWSAAADGDWNRGSGLRFALPWGVGCRATRESGRPVLPGLAGLPAELDAFAAALSHLEVGGAYLLEYPDPTGAGDGGAGCPEIAGDLVPALGFHEIDAGEQAEGRARVLQPLNRILAEAAGRHGWVFVGGIARAFAGHGYCEQPPTYGPANLASPGALSARLSALLPGSWYRHPLQEDLSGMFGTPGVSWYRTATQSTILQGPGTRWDTMGTLHPNELGQLAIAGAVLRAVAAHGL